MQHPPIWHGRELADLYEEQLSKSKKNISYKDEFLVFASINGSHQSFRVVVYEDFLQSAAGSLDTLFSQNNWTQRKSFENFFKGLPRKFLRYTAAEASAAFTTARAIAPPQLIVPFMAMMLCLQDRVQWNEDFLIEVSQLMRERWGLQMSDIAAYYNIVTNIWFEGRTFTIYEYLQRPWRPNPATSTNHVQWTQECLAHLGKELHEDQNDDVMSEFGLSIVALILMDFSGGTVADIIEAADTKSLRRLRRFEEKYDLVWLLIMKFKSLKRVVKKSTILPLTDLCSSVSHSCRYLPRSMKVIDSVDFWCSVLEKATIYLEEGPGYDMGGLSFESVPSTPISPSNATSQLMEYSHHSDAAPVNSFNKNKKRKRKSTGSTSSPYPPSKFHKPNAKLTHRGPKRSRKTL